MQYGVSNCVLAFTTGQGIRIREYIDGSPTALSVQAKRANNDYIVLNTPETNLSFIYQYADYIVTNNSYKISKNQSITLKAGNYIYLEQNTEISGEMFIAEIEECECESDNFSFQGKNSLAYKSLSEDVVSATKLYPNPNNGTFDITLPKEFKEDINIQIYDLSGKVVYKESKQGTNLNVNVPNLVSGMYIVRLSSGDYSETIKFVKN